MTCCQNIFIDRLKKSLKSLMIYQENKFLFSFREFIKVARMLNACVNKENTRVKSVEKTQNWGNPKIQ